MDCVEAAGGVFDGGEGEGGGEAFEFGADVGVAEEFGGAGFEEEEVFEEEGGGAEEGGGFGLAFGAGAVGLGHAEEGGVVVQAVAFGGAQEQEGIGAGGEVGGEIEGEGAAGGTLGEAGDEGALAGAEVRAAVGEEHFDLFGGEGAEADGGAAGADGGEQLAGVFGEKDEVDGGWGLFKDLEQGVGGFLHKGAGGEDEDAAGGFGGEVVRALDDGADLAEFDEELGWVRGDDEDVRVRLDEDAGLFLVDLAEFFAGGDGEGDLRVEVRGRGNAGAVVTDAAEGGEGLAGGPKIAGLTLALDGHAEHEGEGVLAGAGSSGEEQRGGEAAGGDGGTEVLDGGGVADEVVEGGGDEGGGAHGVRGRARGRDGCAVTL